MSFNASVVARSYDFPKVEGVSQSTIRAVFVELCWLAGDKTNEAFPTIETLTKKLYLTKRSVLGAIKVLRDFGYIIDTGKKAGKQGRIVVYKINLDYKAPISIGANQHQSMGVNQHLLMGAN
jgi:biotin operon repressor